MLFSLIGVLFLITSCKNSTSSDDPEIATMPLQVGNYWEYFSFGINLEEESSDTLLTTVTVVSDTLVDGIHWFKLEADRRYGIVQVCLNGYYSNQDDGIHKRYDFTSESPSTLFLPNPGTEMPLFSYSSDDLEYSVNYSGTEMDAEETTFNYVFRYYKSSGLELVPNDFNIQLSLTSGISVYESAYYHRGQNNEPDDPLVLLSRQFVNLKGSFVQ